jgi:hypothetical protein
MSVRVMSAVFERYPAGGGEMLLALALADVARDDGVLMIEDSVPQLATKTRQTDRGVRGQLRRMERIGWLVQVKASDGGRGRSATYRISAAWLAGAELVLEQLHPAPGTGNAEALNPEPRSGFPDPNPERASGFADPETRNETTVNPERRSGAYRLKDQNTEIPPNPPLLAKGGDDQVAHATVTPIRRAEPRGADTALTLDAWLVACKSRGEQPIPEGDAVFAYADRVGIGRDILELQWREFKARRASSHKRQRDWRQTFRNSVRDNWYGLWWIPPGRVAELTSKGRQAQAAHSAEALAGVAA